MRLQTLSIIAGSEACNARCAFCISKMTQPLGVAFREPEVNWRNFRIACRLAMRYGAVTAMLTGKGEPTLFPDQITKFLKELGKFDFPLIELQTNGIMLAEKREAYDPHLRAWYDLGMTTVAISVVHYDPEMNRRVYLPHKKQYIELPELIANLHEHGFSVRLCCVAANGFIDSSAKLDELARFAKENAVEQLTMTPVNKPDGNRSRNKEAWEWTAEHHLASEQFDEIKDYLKRCAVRIRTLAHGAIVYDLNGQNVCLNNCLSVEPDTDDLRNLIFYPDGHMRYYWQYPGSTIL